MLLARMAEAVYWAGRYLERAECTARIVQVTPTRMSTCRSARTWAGSPCSPSRSRQRVRRSLLARDSVGEGRASEEDVIEFLLHGEGNRRRSSAIAAAARTCGRPVRGPP